MRKRMTSLNCQSTSSMHRFSSSLGTLYSFQKHIESWFLLTKHRTVKTTPCSYIKKMEKREQMAQFISLTRYFLVSIMWKSVSIFLKNLKPSAMGLYKIYQIDKIYSFVSCHHAEHIAFMFFKIHPVTLYIFFFKF